MTRKPIIVALLAATVASAYFGGRANAAFEAPRSTEGAGNVADARKVAPGSKERLHLILRDGTDVRLRGGKLVSLSGSTDTTALQAALAKVKGAKVERLIDASEAELEAVTKQAEKRSKKQLADLNLSFLVTVPPTSDIDSLVASLDDLEVVASTYREPLAPSHPAGDYTSRQGYRNAAPDGINVAAASGLAGGTGNRVKIIDIEQGWNLNHEDLVKARNAYIPNGTPRTAGVDHGTAVLGELIGTNNGFGVTGIAPDAGIGVINADTTAGYKLENALYLATQNLQAGDVILIEQHAGGPNWDQNPNSQFGYVPMEYWDAYYQQIQLATAKGIIVIEAAGNGYQNLDDAVYGNKLKLGGRADSGAIMVGASQAPGCGTEPARSRMNFSNFGSRVDVNAWGECVTTTGYGALFNGGANATYTHAFSGTSSASPIVAGAAALLSSIIETRTGVPATPAQIRNLLTTTGTAQVFGTGALAGNIGPMPDLSRALQSIAGDTTAPVVGAVSHGAATGYLASATGVPTKVTWSATDASGIAAYAVKVSTNGGAWTDVTLSSPTATSIVLNRAPGTSYAFTVAAKDKAGNWSAWKSGPTFTPTLVAENHAAIQYSTGWTRSAYTPAIGGYVTVSGTTNAWLSVNFTGRSVAWLGTMASNRGEARIWIDGVEQPRVNTYSATTYNSVVLFSANVTPGTHNLQIQVVGTAGHPKVDIDGLAILN